MIRCVLSWGGFVALMVVAVGCDGNDSRNQLPTSPSTTPPTRPTIMPKDVSGCYGVEQEGEWALESVTLRSTNTCDVLVKSSFLYVLWVNGIY